MTVPEYVVETQNLRFKYSEVSLSFPDWKVKNGEHALILGASGSGKTTLLNILAGLSKPDEGEVLINGENVHGRKGSNLDKFRGQNIGIIFQKPHLINSLSVAQNIQLAAKLSGNTLKKEDRDSLMESLGILDLANRKAYQISQGQAQRVSVARALVNHPAVTLADEPTASLDDENAERVIELLLSQATKQQSSLIISTHDQRIKNHFKNALEL